MPNPNPLTDPSLTTLDAAAVDACVADLGTSDAPPVAFHILAQDASTMCWALARRCKRLQDERDANLAIRLAAYEGWFVDEVLADIEGA